MPGIAFCISLPDLVSFDIGSKIAIGFSLTFFAVLTNTMASGCGINPDRVMLRKRCAPVRIRFSAKFVPPSAIHVIFNGLRLGLIFAHRRHWRRDHYP